MVRDEIRLRRQFAALVRKFPAIGMIVRALTDGPLRFVRIPMGIMFTFGGLLWFLPVLGLWMLPFGLLLLAFDIPLLRPAVNAGVIRTRRRIGLSLARGGLLWRLSQWFRARWRPRQDSNL